jgi:hypothetical protein
VSADPRVLAREILADPRYQTHEEPHQKSFFDPILEWIAHAIAWIANRLNDFFRLVAPSFHGSAPLAKAIAIVILLALVVGTIGLLVLLFRSFMSNKEPADAQSTQIALAVPQTSAELRASALAAAANGNIREAAGLLFLAAVRTLDEIGRLSYDASRTPGEYRRLVRDPAFDSIARDAVVALFATAEPTPALFARMRDADERFVAGMTQ